MDNVEYMDFLMQELDKKLYGREAVENAIVKKTQELNGFISREGAIRLIAREQGIRKGGEDVEISSLTFHRMQEIAGDLVDAWINVKGIITAAFPPKEVTGKDGNSYLKCTGIIDDGSGDAEITFWGDDAAELPALVGKFVAVKGVRVGFYNGRLQLGLGRYSTYKVISSEQMKLGA